jgi:hypothetical protein
VNDFAGVQDLGTSCRWYWDTSPNNLTLLYSQGTGIWEASLFILGGSGDFGNSNISPPPVCGENRELSGSFTLTGGGPWCRGCWLVVTLQSP